MGLQMLFTESKTFEQLLSNGLSNSATTRTFSAFYTGKSPKTCNLKNIHWPLFSALDFIKCAIFGFDRH